MLVWKLIQCLSFFNISSFEWHFEKIKNYIILSISGCTHIFSGMRIFENCIYDHNTLLNLVNEKHTCVFLKQCVRRISLRPIYLNDVKKGIFENLRSSLKKFDTSLNGILLGYQNVKTMQNANTGKIIGRYGEFEVSISVEFFVFQPDIGFLLEGVVNFKSNSHIGCLIHKYFNAIILKPENVEFNNWNCKDIEINEKIIFEVIDRDFSGSVPYIKGKIPDENSGKEENQVRRKTKNSSSTVQLSLHNKNENEDNDFISEFINNLENSFKRSDDKNSSKISVLEKLSTSESRQISGTAVEKIKDSNTAETTLKVKKKKFVNKEMGSQKLRNIVDNATSSSLTSEVAETKHAHLDTPCSSVTESEIQKTKKKKRKKNVDDLGEFDKNLENNHDFGDLILPMKKKKKKKKSDKEEKRSLEESCEISTEENSILSERLNRTTEKSPKKKNISRINNFFINPETLDFIPDTQITPSKKNPSLEELACTKTLNSVTGIKISEESESDGLGSTKREKSKKEKSPHKKTVSKTEINAELNTSVLSKRGTLDETENPLSLYFLDERNHKSPRKNEVHKKLTPKKSQTENIKKRKEGISVKGLKNHSNSPPMKKLKLDGDAFMKSFVSSHNTSEECLFFDTEKSLNISVDVNSDKIININKSGKSTKEPDLEMKKQAESKNVDENGKKNLEDCWKGSEEKEKFCGEKDKVKKTKQVQKRLENFEIFKTWAGIENRRISTNEKSEITDKDNETHAVNTSNGTKSSIVNKSDVSKEYHVKLVSNDVSPVLSGKSPKKKKTPKYKLIENEKSDKSSILIDELLHWKKMNMEKEIDLMPLKTSTPKAETAGDVSKNRSKQKNDGTNDSLCKVKSKEVNNVNESSEYNVLLSSLIREKMKSMDMDINCLNESDPKKPKDTKITKARSTKGKSK